MRNSLVTTMLILLKVPLPFIFYAIVRKRLQQIVPWFSIYIGIQLLVAPIVFVLYLSHSHTYFYATWSYSFLTETIALVVIVDIARSSLMNSAALRRTAVSWMFLCTTILITAALMISLRAPDHPTELSNLEALYQGLQFIQTGLVVSLFAFSSYVGLLWKDTLLGIAVGLGLDAAANLSVMAYLIGVGDTVSYNHYLVAYLSMGAANLGTMIVWLVYLFRSEPEPVLTFTDNHRPELDLWGRTLSAYFSGRW